MSTLHKAGAGLALAGLALALSAPSASAQNLELVYTGAFSNADSFNPSGGPTAAFTGTTAFTVTALFDPSGPNLAKLVGKPGFVAYAPISATLTIGASTYKFAPDSLATPDGVTVAIFDSTTGFGPPHHVAIGLLQNPLADGAGFIGDWDSTSTPTPFSAGSLVPMTFTGYTGVGYGSGPSLHNGTPPAVVPIPLTDSSGNSYLLTLGNYDEEAAAPGSVENTARLIAAPVPETSTTVSFGLLLALGVGGLVVAARRRKTEA